MTNYSCAIAGFALVLVSTASWAQSEMIIYPKQGQPKELQDKDNYECYGWAKQQSGFDPIAPPTASAPPPQQAPKGGLARGALRGAAIGGIIDGSDGAKKGAGVGAVVGGVRRSDQRRQQQQQQQQAEQQQAAAHQGNRNNYNRAYAACMEGRGYTVR